MSREWFGAIALIGGIATLSTYAWLAFATRDRNSAADTIGGLFDTNVKKYAWLSSTALATLGIGTGLALVSTQNSVTVENWDFMVGSAVAFFVCTILWAPVTYFTSKNRWNRWIPAFPVWGTAVGNGLIMANLERDEPVFWFWFVGLFHHVVMDGVLWVHGYLTTTDYNLLLGEEQVLG
tara:strand:- start:8583 stop:9119 length:537 start_codon:yes stop_codon:yes gene_type:complete